MSYFTNIYDTDINEMGSHWMLTLCKVKLIPQQAEVAQGVPGRLRPRIFLTFRHYEGGSSSALRTGRRYPTINPWYSFSEAEATTRHMVPSGATEKIPSDTTGNRSRDLPTSSAVPQPLRYPSTVYVPEQYSMLAWGRLLDGIIYHHFYYTSLITDAAHEAVSHESARLLRTRRFTRENQVSKRPAPLLKLTQDSTALFQSLVAKLFHKIA